MTVRLSLDVGGLGDAPYLLLLDLEYTCWEDSLPTRWADPTRPAELLEIGVAGYDLRGGTVLDTFSTFVKPAINPTLSSYCRTLLQLSQPTIDGAPPLATVVGELARWEAEQPFATAPTCAWGVFDRLALAADTARAGVADPFQGRAHLDLQAVVRQIAGLADRDAVREAWALPSNEARHRALADALDLVAFVEKLMSGPVESRQCAG